VKLAARLGLTEGQTYTLAIGLAFALVTAMIGIPPTLRDHARQSFGDQMAAAAETAPVRNPDVAPAAPLVVAESPAPTLPAADFAGPTVAAQPYESVEPPMEPEHPESYDDGGATGEVHSVAALTGAPHGIAVNPSNGAFFVATDRIVQFRPDGSQARTIDVPGSPALGGLALDAGGALLTVVPASHKVLRVDLASGAVTELATIPNVAPYNAPSPRAVAVDRTGRIYVADAGQSTVWRIDGNKATAWLTAGEFLSPQSAGPVGVAVDGDGNVIVAVGSTPVALTGVVYRVPVGADGAAGTPSQVWRSSPNDTPTGVAVSGTGRIAVTLAGSNKVVVLDKAGAVLATATSDLGTPVAAATRGRSVLVANQATSTVVRVVAD